jgi:hypothetical protein
VVLQFAGGDAVFMKIRNTMRRRLGVLGVLLGLMVAGCATPPVPAPYPHESVLTVFGELKIFLNQDPYADPPGRDLQGRNIYRVTLERLDGLRGLTGPEYRDVLAWARGACLERLGDFHAAATEFTAAAQSTGTLVAPASARAALASRMAALVDRATMGKTLESYLNDLDVLGRKLEAWQAEAPPFPYNGFIRAESERALTERVKLLADNRLVIDQSLPRAIELAKRLVESSKSSWRLGQDELLLGGLFETMARDVTAQLPPENLGFNAGSGWDNLLEQARAAYTRVAQRDGDLAKPEGQARLRALDAYALRVQMLAK